MTTDADRDPASLSLAEYQIALASRDAMICRILAALADAIRSPMGVTPDSAAPFVTAADLEAAEQRRVMASSNRTRKIRSIA